MYTMIIGGSQNSQKSQSKGGDKGRSYDRDGGKRFSQPSRDGRDFGRNGGGRRDGGRGGRGRFGDRGGSSRPRPFDPKKAFKKDYIDEKLFINKEATVSEATEYVPEHVFTDFGIADMLATNLEAKGLIKPSPIQDQAIPVVLKGHDVIGIASTGTGKTAAFLIPLINKLVADREQKIMVLCPTRELALQVEEGLLLCDK
jgi:hypothetical protein